MSAKTCETEDRRVLTSALPLFAPSVEGREAPQYDAAAHLSEASAHQREREEVRDGEVVVVSGDTAVDCHHSCCAVARWVCRIVTLALTLFLTVDAFLVNRDLRAYGHDGALFWLWFFALAFAECVATIAFLLHELWTCMCGSVPAPSIAYVNVETGQDTVRACKERDAWLEAKKTLIWGAVLLTLSLYTLLLYLYFFGDPSYPLRHLTLHVKCIWVSILRSLFFSIFIFTYMGH